MNYIKQINGFWNWRMFNEISHGAVDLYFAILHCANTAKWKTGFNIPNSTLLKLAHFADSSGLIKTRNQLIQCGLIEYQKNKNGKAGNYKVIRLYQLSGECTTTGTLDTEADTTLDTQTDTEADTIHKQKYKQKQNNKEKNIKKESPCKKGAAESKTAYGEFENVMLAESEHNKLVGRFGEVRAGEYIERLSGYMASKGVKYKNHYATILNWAKKDGTEANNKASPPKQTGTKFTNFSQDKLDFADIERRALVGGINHVE